MTWWRSPTAPARPEEAGHRARPRPGDQPAEHGGQQEAHRHPDPEGPADRRSVGEQIGDEAALVVCRGRRATPCARAGSRAPPRQRGAVQPGRMRVALAVGEGVVTAVVGHPVQHVALHGEGPGDRHGHPQPRPRLERPVGEVAVQPDRHPEDGEDVEDDEQAQVVPPHSPTPRQRHGRDERDHRHGDEEVDERVLGGAAPSAVIGAGARTAETTTTNLLPTQGSANTSGRTPRNDSRCRTSVPSEACHPTGW